MNWIEKVREKLHLIEKVCDHPLTAAGDKSIWQVLAMIKLTGGEALAAIPDEPEMMKVLRWLEEYYKVLEKVLEQQLVVLPDPVGAASRVRDVGEAFEHIYEYIEREFGYKLEDEKWMADDDG